jgi:hypothetical protein
MEVTMTTWHQLPDSAEKTVNFDDPGTNRFYCSGVAVDHRVLPTAPGLSQMYRGQLRVWFRQT